MVVVELVLFLVWVNFLPFVANLGMGGRYNYPVDCNLAWGDGRRLLGNHKTWRGLAASVLGGTAVAPLVGLSWGAAASAAALAMVGDLATSFIKRRLSRPSGHPLFGLDQTLEGALPLLVLVPAVGLDPWQGLVVLVVFIPLSHAGSRYWHFVLYRPPLEHYPRIIRATTRLREWRACHAPLARWQTWFNFENYVYYRVVMARLFKALGWYERGVQNVLAVQVQHYTLWFSDLPQEFEGYRILLLVDLHLDGLEPLTDTLIERVREQEVDLCLIGGDIRMEMYGPMAPSLRRLKQLLEHVRSREGIYGVLGNHDCIEMLPDFEEAGITMLVNESLELRRRDASLWLVGIDDPHYYKCHDLELAFRDTPPQAFKIFLAHSPEVYREAADHGAQLYLCGHTHGGQICLPKIGPLFTHSSAPRYTARGHWTYGAMTGYTSSGVGASGIPLRFNCPGEVPLITLRKQTEPV